MDILFLDTETTAKENGRLVQLAYKKHDTSEVTNLLFKPAVPIDFEAMAVHHITEARVKDLPPFDEPYRSETQEIINKHIVVAHNAQFDIDVLAREGVQVPNYICTLKVARRLYDFPTYKLQYMRYYFDLKLDDAKAHDAEGDILVLEAVFDYIFGDLAKQMPEAEYDEVLKQMMVWTKEPSLLKTISFGKYKGRTFEDLAKHQSDYLNWLQRQPDVDDDLNYTINHYLHGERS